MYDGIFDICFEEEIKCYTDILGQVQVNIMLYLFKIAGYQAIRELEIRSFNNLVFFLQITYQNAYIKTSLTLMNLTILIPNNKKWKKKINELIR